MKFSHKPLRFLMVVALVATGQLSSRRPRQARRNREDHILNDATQLPFCDTLVLTGPASPSWFHSSDWINFSWQGEPANAGHRELIIFNVRLTQTEGGPAFEWAGYWDVVPAQPGGISYRVDAGVDHPGTFNWFVIVYDTSARRCAAALTAGWTYAASIAPIRRRSRCR